MEDELMSDDVMRNPVNKLGTVNLIKSQSNSNKVLTEDQKMLLIALDYGNKTMNDARIAENNAAAAKLNLNLTGVKKNSGDLQLTNLTNTGNIDLEMADDKSKKGEVVANGNTNYYGNYLNLGAANRNDRKLIRRAIRNGATGRYMDALGNIQTIDPSLTRTKMRLIGKNIRSALVGSNYGLSTPTFTGDDAEYKQDIWNGMMRYSNSPYIKYILKPSEGSEQGGASDDGSKSGAVSVKVTKTNTPVKKHYTWDWEVPSGQELNYQSASNFFGRLNEQNKDILTHIGAIDSNSDSILGYDELMNWFGNNWTGGLKLGGDNAAAWTNVMTPELWNTLNANALKAGLITEKNGGTINKYQLGGETGQRLQEFRKQLRNLVAAAKNGVKEAKQKIAQIKNAAKTDTRMKAIADIIDEEESADQTAQQYGLYALNGAKLQYIQRIRNKCPEGFELKMFNAGGVICTKCMKGATIVSNSSGESDVVNQFRKVNKHYSGGLVANYASSVPSFEDECDPNDPNSPCYKGSLKQMLGDELRETYGPQNWDWNKIGEWWVKSRGMDKLGKYDLGMQMMKDANDKGQFVDGGYDLATHAFTNFFAPASVKRQARLERRAARKAGKGLDKPDLTGGIELDA